MLNALSGPGLLLIEDDELIRRACTRKWSASWSVFAVSSGEEALAIARTHELDLAIVDFYLPAPIGLDVVAALKAEHPNLYSVLATTFLTPDIAHAAKIADDVVRKPYKLQTILERRRDPRARVSTSDTFMPLADLKVEYARLAIAQAHGNKARSARLLGISRKTLTALLRGDDD